MGRGCIFGLVSILALGISACATSGATASGLGNDCNCADGSSGVFGEGNASGANGEADILASLPGERIEWVSPYSHAETVSRLRSELQRRTPITIFREVDHAASAAKIGQSIDPNMVFIFGNPTLGTPLINAAPEIGIDLPVKMQVYVNDGEVRVAYISPESLARQYSIRPDLPEIQTMTNVLDNIAGQVVGAGPNVLLFEIDPAENRIEETEKLVGVGGD